MHLASPEFTDGKYTDGSKKKHPAKLSNILTAWTDLASEKPP